MQLNYLFDEILRSGKVDYLGVWINTKGKYCLDVEGEFFIKVRPAKKLETCLKQVLRTIKGD